MEDIVINDIKQEYKQLQSHELRIKKRFNSPDGRIYSTYLIEDQTNNSELFIAKSTSSNASTSDWKAEIKVMEILEQASRPAPRLIYPNEQPHKYILMTYIEGLNAQEVLNTGINPSEIFYGAGKVLGKFHAIPVLQFGSILENNHIQWDSFIHSKIEERTNSISTIIDSQLYNKLIKYFEQIIPYFQLEDVKSPTLCHRDIYLENFLINTKTNEFTLIDYAMTIGGRPLYDVAKLYILNLSHYPHNKNDFIRGYSQSLPLQKSWNELLQIYILFEIIGMIGYYHRTSALKAKQSAIMTLTELINKTGSIGQLLQ